MPPVRKDWPMTDARFHHMHDSKWLLLLSGISFNSGWWQMEGTQKHWWTSTTFVENKSPTSSPTVLDGCMGLSMDFCFFSLSLSLRRWQRWWWWWWCDLSWLRTCPAPIRDWARSGRSRSKSLSLTSWWCCVSEDAERLMGLRSTIGWGGERNGQTCEETRHGWYRCGWGRFSRTFYRLT